MKDRSTCCVNAVQPASSPTKWGANKIVGALPASSWSAPVNCNRVRNTASEACQSQPRSSHACANATKVATANRPRCQGVWPGKQIRRLVSTTRRRDPTSKNRATPNPTPSARIQGRGSRPSHSIARKIQRLILSTFLFRGPFGLTRLFIACIAPQILTGQLVDDTLHGAVDL